jgi:transposase-like protein
MQMELKTKWRQYEETIIRVCVSWYLRYPLSYRDLAEMMEERGLQPDHSTLWHWVKTYSTVLANIVRRKAKRPNGSWRVDETYVKVRGKWRYLYRSVDSQGNTVDFWLSSKRDIQAAKRFFKRAFRTTKQIPETITTDKNASYPPAIDELKKEGLLPNSAVHRTNKYLNNRIEQDHRRIKRVLKGKGPFQSFRSAWRVLQGIEAFALFRKNQVHNSLFSDIIHGSSFAQILAN